MSEEPMSTPLEHVPQHEANRNLSVRLMEDKDIEVAAIIDQDAFGEYGIQAKKLREFRDAHQDQCLVVIDGENVVGFATFEVLSSGEYPDGYEPQIAHEGSTAFIQQFTTTPNYLIEDIDVDARLLRGVEDQARNVGCQAVWEALDQSHKFSKEKNPLHDAFGFYEQNGYTRDLSRPVVWTPGNVSCWLFTKPLTPNA